MCIGNGRRRAKADLTRAAAVYRKILKLGSKPDFSSSGSAAVPLGGAARIKLAAAGKLETFLGVENGHGQLQTGREKIKMMISNTSVRGEDFHTEKGFGFHVAVSFYLARKTMKLFLLELDISTLSQDKHLLS